MMVGTSSATSFWNVGVGGLALGRVGLAAPLVEERVGLRVLPVAEVGAFRRHAEVAVEQEVRIGLGAPSR